MRPRLCSHTRKSCDSNPEAQPRSLSNQVLTRPQWRHYFFCIVSAKVICIGFLSPYLKCHVSLPELCQKFHILFKELLNKFTLSNTYAVTSGTYPTNVGSKVTNTFKILDIHSEILSKQNISLHDDKYEGEIQFLPCLNYFSFQSSESHQMVSDWIPRNSSTWTFSIINLSSQVTSSFDLQAFQD